MKSISSQLATHLQQDSTTLSRLWKITRKDGTILLFTDHDQDITYGTLGGGYSPPPAIYKAMHGFTSTATAKKADNSPDNMEVVGFLDSTAITEADIRAHLYDFCDIELRVVNWADLTQGDLKLIKGTLGNVKMVNGQFQAEIRGLNQFLTTMLGGTYGPVCRADLFDAGPDTGNHYRCQLNRSDYVQTGSVTVSYGPTNIVPPTNSLLRISPHFSAIPAPATWFNDGIIKFTSGVLNGYQFEIQNWDGATLTLFAGVPMPFQPSPGDTYEIEPGCNKLRSDCRDKFVNIINFQGEPDMPGLQVLMQTPDSHTS